MPLPTSRHKPARESLLFKSVLIVSALFFSALVMANGEVYFSTHQSLSEAEVSLRVAQR